MQQVNEWLDNYFLELEQQEKFSGNVLITRGDSPLYERSFGFASRAWGVPNNPQTRFDTASITKLFTAVSALQLIDQVQLAFNTPVIDFLKLADTKISRDVNVFHLLTHTSGIGDDVVEEDGEIYEELWKQKPNYMVTETVDFLPQFIHKEPNFPPGQGCRYNNCAFILLGLVIEKISGLTYRSYVRRNIFQKAGMEDSDFYRMDRVHTNVAEGCDPVVDSAGQISAWKKNIYSYPPIGSPDSGALVTAADLDRFLRAVKAGKLLSPQLTEAFLTPQVKYHESEKWTTMYGYGLMYYFDKSGKVVCFQKDGINAGVSGIIRHFPDWDVNVVLLSNMENGVWEPIWEIHNLLVEHQGAI